MSVRYVYVLCGNSRVPSGVMPVAIGVAMYVAIRDEAGRPCTIKMLKFIKVYMSRFFFSYTSALVEFLLNDERLM
jgi:hypothetical protein